MEFVLSCDTQSDDTRRISHIHLVSSITPLRQLMTAGTIFPLSWPRSSFEHLPGRRQRRPLFAPAVTPPSCRSPLRSPEVTTSTLMKGLINSPRQANCRRCANFVCRQQRTSDAGSRIMTPRWRHKPRPLSVAYRPIVGLIVCKRMH